MARTEVNLDKDELVIRIVPQDLRALEWAVDKQLDIFLVTDTQHVRIRVPPKLSLPDPAAADDPVNPQSSDP